MEKHAIAVRDLLDRLESHYGPQEPGFPVDPFEFLVWWYCGYPQSDTRCSAGWQSLKKQVGTDPRRILAASQAKLAAALNPAAWCLSSAPCASRNRAARYSRNTEAILANSLPAHAMVRAALKRFPGIADPGADRILLFARAAPVAAVPSNSAHVLVRIVHGLERENYGVTYREAQQLIEQKVPEQFHTRQRAYLLLKVHGQTICKRKPQCDRCPVRSVCAYAAGVDRGGLRPK